MVQSQDRKASQILKVVRICFIISLSFFLVYLYYLQTKGILLEKIKNFFIMMNILFEKIPLSIKGGISAIALVFLTGYYTGKRQNNHNKRKSRNP